MKELDHLNDIIQNYDTFIIDLWGVVHNGIKPYQGAMRTIEELHKQNIKLKILGAKKFSSKLNKILNNSEKKTSKNTKLQINLALNYGSKSEIINALS